MLQVKDIEKKFSQIDQAIVSASKACLNVPDASPQLMESITKLSKQSALMRQAMQSNDEIKIRKTVDELEMIGGEAERACARDSHATSTIKEAVVKVHRDLYDLKQQVH